MFGLSTTIRDEAISWRYAHCPLTCASRSRRSMRVRGAFQTRFTMQPKWIALGLFVAGITSLLIGASFPYLEAPRDWPDIRPCVSASPLPL